MPGHSYLRARFYSVDKNVGGRIELGLKSLQPCGQRQPALCVRLLARGQMPHPGRSNRQLVRLLGLPRASVRRPERQQAHLLMFGWGFLWPHRVPQVQFTYNTDKWGVQFALEEPRNKGTWGWRHQRGHHLHAAPHDLDLHVQVRRLHDPPRRLCYVKHDYEAGDTGASDESWDTLAVVLPIKFTAGAFTLKFQGHWGKNFATEIPFYSTKWTGPGAQRLRASKTPSSGVAVLAGEYKIGKLMITGGYWLRELVQRHLDLPRTRPPVGVLSSRCPTSSPRTSVSTPSSRLLQVRRQPQHRQRDGQRVVAGRAVPLRLLRRI